MSHLKTTVDGFSSLLCRIKMRLVILESYDKVSEWAAKYVRNRILKFNPGPDRYFILGLPTGTDHDHEFSGVHMTTVIQSEHMGSYMYYLWYRDHRAER